MSDVPTVESDEVTTCLLAERESAMRGEELAAGHFSAVAEIAELPDGHGYRFAGDERQIASLLELIAAERGCCPFLGFEIACEPRSGPLWLRPRGRRS